RFMLARAYCAEAFALAAAAEDSDLQAWVRGTESLSAYYQRRYTDALELARDGQRHAQSGPQTIRLAVNGEARALGRLGDRRGVATALIRQQGPDVEHAADVALAALRASAGNPIESIRQRATEFVTRACQWQTRPAMRELTEALHGWNTTTLAAPGPGAL